MMKTALSKKLSVVFLLLFGLAACAGASSVNALEDVKSRQKASVSSLTGPKQQANPQAIQAETRTYLINGLGSNLEEIALGFENLSRKLPNAQLYNYPTITAGSTFIRNRIERDIRAAHKRNPNVRVNLIGYSLGANIATIIAASLERNDINVNYLATVDGPAMVPLHANVKIADNFTCSDPTCFKTNSKLYFRNKQTEHRSFRYDTQHVNLSNHGGVHARIVSRLGAS